MGAVSRRSLLRLPAAAPFDVEQFRSEPHRLVAVRDVARPTLVLGSTQRSDVVDSAALEARGVELVRRRGGGGAVYLGPGRGAQLWVDAWIPRHDPLWAPDVTTAAEWVGAWWADALAALGHGGADELEIHTGRSVPGELGELVCFAGRGPGEVFHAGRKLVGVTQWRARQGALFSSCAYRCWDPAPLVELFAARVGDRAELTGRLQATAVGLAELGPAVGEVVPVRDRLVSSFFDLAP